MKFQDRQKHVQGLLPDDEDVLACMDQCVWILVWCCRRVHLLPQPGQGGQAQRS